jgi:2-methylcitrate dehydratase PrpD
MTINLTQELANFSAKIESTDIPEGVLNRAKIILIDTIASAFAGCSSDEIIQIEKMAIAASGTGNSPVMGRASLSPAAAVLVNGYLITAATVCDVHKATLCHVTPQVLPSAIAIGVDRGVSGKEFMLAFTLGIEITTRIGLGSNYTAFRARGWHSPGVWGPFGGAAAAGKLMGFESSDFLTAFGLAGSQSAGTFAQWGTPTIKFHQSRGALSGFLAAQLAEQKFEASKDILTAADGGLYNTYSDGGNPSVALQQLGEQWEIENLSLRPWPLASSLQSVATALLHLIDSENFLWSDVATVEVGLSSVVFNMHGALPWNDRFHALLSAPYITGVILTDKECWLEQFSPERIQDQNLDNFIKSSITVAIDETVVGTGANIVIRLKDGRVLSDARKIPHGDYLDPLSLDDVSAKFMKAVGTALDKDGDKPFSGAEKVLARLKNIENIAKIDGELFGALS